MAVTRKQRITSRALLELKTPNEIQVSPDGKRVAYALEEVEWDENKNVQHLHLVTTSSDPIQRQLTHDNGFQESGPHWSPDGKWLAFFRVSEDEDDEDLTDEGLAKPQVWLLPMDGMGGEAEKLTDAESGIAAFDWLPDSSGIVYIAPEPRSKPLQTAYAERQDKNDDAVVDRAEKFRRQIWRIDLENKKTKLIHPGDFGIGELSVSPDGGAIAFSTNYTGDPNDYHKSDIWQIGLDGKNLRQLTDGLGGKYHPKWSPDGSQVLFLRSLQPEISYSQTNLFSVSITGGEISNLTESLAYDVTGWQSFWWDHKGNLYVSVAIGTMTAIFVRRKDVFEPLIQGEEHIHEFHVSLESGAVAYVTAAARDVPEIGFLAPGKIEPAALTDINEEWARSYEICATETVTWTSPDGVEIEGLLTYPAGCDPAVKYPTIINLHGGPHARAVQGLSSASMTQLFAAQGFMVLEPNYRGSEGYGNDFSTAARADFGGRDYADIMAGVDWVVGQGIADPDRLGIMGNSYGGYLTNWAISHSKRFKAAISAFGIFSLATDLSNSEAPRWEQEYLGGFYWELPELYRSLSPSTYVADIETPVLILHGEEDENTALSNSRELYTALRLQGKTAQYVRYPNEGHGFSEPRHRLDEMNRCAAWFEQYLVGEGERKVYGLGDKVIHDGWELTVVSAGRVEFAGYAGREHFLEVVLVIRDAAERSLSLSLKSSLFSLTAAGFSRTVKPAGLPLDVLGQRTLARGAGWRISLMPKGEERGVTASIALAFALSKYDGRHLLQVMDFPGVAFDVEPAEKRDGDFR